LDITIYSVKRHVVCSRSNIQQMSPVVPGSSIKPGPSMLRLSLPYAVLHSQSH